MSETKKVIRIWFYPLSEKKLCVLSEGFFANDGNCIDIVFDDEHVHLSEWVLQGKLNCLFDPKIYSETKIYIHENSKKEFLINYLNTKNVSPIYFGNGNPGNSGYYSTLYELIDILKNKQ